MERETKSKATNMIIVAGLCAAIGFGAVYAMVGGTDNRDAKSSAGAPKTERSGDAKATSVPQSASSASVQQGAGLTNEAATSGDTSRRSASSTPTDGNTAATGRRPGAVFHDVKGKPLNRGEMTTFVFKKQPMLPPKQPEFNGPDGEPITLADLKGKVVLLNLWATWCGPCRKEMPYLDQLQSELGSDEFEVVALSIDRGSPDKARKFLDEVGAKSLRFYHDPAAKAGFALMAIGMPTTLLLDREGREIGRLVGPAEWHSKDAKALIRAAIAAG